MGCGPSCDAQTAPTGNGTDRIDGLGGSGRAEWLSRMQPPVFLLIPSLPGCRRLPSRRDVVPCQGPPNEGCWCRRRRDAARRVRPSSGSWLSQAALATGDSHPGPGRLMRISLDRLNSRYTAPLRVSVTGTTALTAAGAVRVKTPDQEEETAPLQEVR